MRTDPRRIVIFRDENDDLRFFGPFRDERRAEALMEKINGRLDARHPVGEDQDDRWAYIGWIESGEGLRLKELIP